MKEIEGNLWDYHPEHWIVITTNGTIKRNGEAVMGRGVARQARERFPSLALELGKVLQRGGNVLHLWRCYGLITFPVKHNWWEKADVALIEKSAEELRSLFDDKIAGDCVPIYLIRPGCGNGKLKWCDIKPVLEKYLDDRFIVLSRKGE